MTATTGQRQSGTRRALLAIAILVVAIAVLVSRCGVRSRYVPHYVPAEERAGPCAVTRVVDGDTVDVACPTYRGRVRLLRIDTPERGNPGYEHAADALRKLVQDEDVYLAFEQPGVPETGGFGRLLAYLYVGELNVNVEMVRLGWSGPHPPIRAPAVCPPR